MGKTLGYGEITVANMTEPFTVMLTNEAQQFATDSNRKVTSAQSYYTDIIVIRGSQERTDYTIGNITSGSGITVSKSSKRVTFSVSAGATIGADTGVIEIPITLDGQTVKKQFSWNCGKQGPQGVKGEDGISPKVSLSKSGNTTTISIVDATGTHTQTVKDGTNGTPGAAGKDGKTSYFHVKYSNDGGKTFTGNSGEDTGIYMGSYTDYTEADSTDVGKYTWIKVKGDKGDTGQKGQDGTSIKITSKSVTYQTSTSGTTAPTGTWSTTVPTVNNGQYLWTKTTVQYSDGNKTEAYSVSYKGTNGTNGTSVTVSKTEVTYQVSTSGTTAPTGTWSTTMPSCDQGQYLWTKTYVKYSDGKETTSYSVSYKGVDGENGRGVSETVQYYLATSQASGVTSSTSGWSTDITTQKLTADKKYLWNCYQTKYSDGTSEPISTPKVIGVYGDKGQKGDSGEDGQDGAGFHWNLLSGTKDFDKTKMSIAGATSFDSQKYLGLTVIKATNPTSGYVDPIAWNGCITPTPNTIYTLSFYAKATKDTLCSSFFYPNCTVKNVSEYETKNGVDGQVGHKIKTEWAKYYCTWTTSSSVSGAKSIIPIRLQRGNAADDATVYLCGIKLEQSDKPSPWCTTYEETLAKNLSITPSSQYFKSTDGGKTFAPNTITIKPTIQGEISFGKWQYSIDGGVSFADVVSGQKGLTVNNNVLAVSKDSSLYSDAVTMVTFRAVASDSSFYDTCSIAKIYDVSDIGDGRNLWITRDNITLQACEKDKYIYTTTGTSAVCIGADATSVGTNTIALQTGTKYTISFVISSPSEVGNAQWYFCTALNSTGVKNYGGYSVKLVTGENIVSQTITVDTSCDAAGLVIYNLPTDCIIKDIQVEKGSSPTGWTPAPEDFQMAILSTKSEISDVSLKVDNNKQAIEQRVEKTTYQRDLNLIKGDINKANEGLNKWRYEIYPKSLFNSTDQGKSTIDIFAKNTNLTPSQSVLINDTDLSIAWNYDNNYIGYALTFAKFSAAKSVAITFAHDDGAHIYLNGKLIGGSDAYNKNGESLTLGFVKGWNCIEVVVNEDANTEGFKLGTTLSALSECQLMNCYYGTPVARQSHITNQLVQNTTDIDGISGSVQQVMSTVGGSGKVDEFVNNYSTWKKKVDDIETRVGKTYVTKNDFNGLEIGGRNLILNSAFKKGRKEWSDWGNPTTREIVSSNGKSWAHIVGNQQNYQGFNQWTPAGSIKEGDHITFSARIKGSAANQRFTVGIHWLNSGNTIISQDWHTFIVDTTENVYTWTVNASGSGCNKLNLMVGVSDPSIVYNVYFTEIMVVKGNKATDWTPAPEDNEINGQNLVSNLPSNWEQGSFDGSRVDVGGTYSTGKVDNSTIIRVKELVPVSGSITISNAYSNQSKKPIQHYIVAFDVNKKYLGSGYINTDWNDFPKIVDMKDAKYIAVIVKYKDNSAITPSDISQICLKIERGTSATPFTLAPEDVNGKIVNVETIANQTAKKFEWIVKGGDSSSNFTLTDRVADLVAERINFNGLVTFSGLNTDAKNEIGKVAQSKVDGLNVGGRNLALQSKDFTSGEQYWSINSNFTRSVDSDGFTVLSIKRSGAGLEWNRAIPHNYIPVEEMHRGIIVSFDFMCDKVSELDRGCICALQIFNSGGGRIGWYESQDILSGAQCKLSAPLSDGKWIRVQIPFSEGNLKATHGNSDAVAYTSVSFNLVANGSIHFKKIKIEYGNKATDWTPAPEDVSQDATNKASQALTDAKNYSSNAVNWVTNNGSSTTSLNSMVKKWTDGAVSDTTQINGGWIKANTITASKIAVGDFTNYADINESNTYGFSVEKTTDGVWFSKDGSKLTRDNYISKMYSCEPGQTFYVEYDISNTIKDSTEYKAAGIMLFGCDGTQTVKWYQRRGAVVGTAAGTVTHMSQQLTMPSGTRFFYVVLQIEGFQPFTGTLKIRNLSVRKAVTGAVIVDGSITADKIATDAIKSRNYISSGGTQGSFLNLSDGSFTSPNLSWDSNGNLIAKNANISGQITATKGSIAGWTIISDKMYTTGSGKYTGIGKYGSAYAFWAGATSNDNGNSAVFKVSHTGKLTATDADITGTITATNGKIGRYDITSTYLMTNSGSNASGIGGNQAFWAGAEDSNSAPFRVGYDGVLWAENAAIRGSIETGNLGDEGDTVVIMNGRIGIQGTSNNVEIYSTGFKFGIDGDYYLESVSEGVKCYRNLYATDFIADGWIYNASGGHYTWKDRDDAYISCGDYNGHNVYYYANYHAFYVNKDSGQGMMYINTDGVTSRVGFTKTSDERIKKNFESFDDNIIDAYMNIEPVKYQLKQSSNDKYHFGFKAQHIDKVFSDYGDIYNESFDICTSRPIDPDKAKELYGVDGMVEEYGLRYDELIAPTTYMVQHTYKELESTKDELTKVKQEKADLETRLQAIEAKLGL